MSSAQRAASADGNVRDIAYLHKLISNCVALRIERSVLYLRLSGIADDLARADCFSAALSALDWLPYADVPGKYRLPHGDFALVWRKLTEKQLRSAAAVLKERLRPAAGEEELVHPFRLPFDAQRLSRLLSGSPAPASAPAAEPATPETTVAEPLDFPALAELEAALATSDVEPFVRRRAVCRQAQDGQFLRLWEQYRLSAPEVVAALAPGCAAPAADWLTRRLTRTLDRRLLALLSAPGQLRGGIPFGLKLNVASLVSPEFLRFDSMLPFPLREQVIIEIDAASMVAEIATFPFARDFARSRGYLLQLGGVTAGTLGQFPLREAGFDLLSLQWSAELAARDAPEAFADADHFVLAEADSQSALSWGKERGINLFQGRTTEASR